MGSIGYGFTLYVGQSHDLRSASHLMQAWKRNNKSVLAARCLKQPSQK
jgi:hypothetical protein